MTVARGSGRILANKMSKTDVLIRNHEIANHIPPTKRFHSKNLMEMLQTHGMVVIKPLVGSGGAGVIKVVKHAKGTYSYTYLSRTRSFQSYDSLYRALRATMKKKRYMIQKGIDLATVNGRPIDYRVKYVKENGRWRYKAIVGRIARSGLFVTNLQRGGRLVSGSKGIALSLGSSYVKEKKGKMRKLTVLSTKILEQRYRGINQLGYDFGIDKSGKIWLFEVNTRPQ
ncbi:YheC/YheD family protein [Paenibacillus yanchengensis]|uniref:YheC/YheD family protein n=1 Tax=Paenibacillus yanchengensis TaxID=2035833 RepID=A0ABW4YPU3_9BACL